MRLVYAIVALVTMVAGSECRAEWIIQNDSSKAEKKITLLLKGEGENNFFYSCEAKNGNVSYITGFSIDGLSLSPAGKAGVTLHIEPMAPESLIAYVDGHSVGFGGEKAITIAGRAVSARSINISITDRSKIKHSATFYPPQDMASQISGLEAVVGCSK